ncbi:hypothetical protein HXX76_002478 [Chlamydomonas incerta]|uniref:Uncharacterized protein n=1 Tax=Chlamydomonas incerta TaxID=51695 RepID=A0A835W6I1_CHLIN|nr:hypothetical protein HXX76_002478 [Chlamydomonas incerta]|eukprot:KAG2442392.1 hypothetical protein HXX76_002478 [Chlamydomonas incerta]
MQRSSFHTLDRGGKSLLHSSASAAGDQANASVPTDWSRGGLAGALARRQRSALVALACPDDLPPTAAPSRLHLQAQQRARCALGCHERACDSGYRPHLRAAATARAVLAVAGGLAPDAAAAAAEQAAVDSLTTETEAWWKLQSAARTYNSQRRQFYNASSGSVKESGAIHGMYDAAASLTSAVGGISVRTTATALAAMLPASAAEAAERQRATAFGCVVPAASGPSWLLAREAGRMLPARAALLLHCHLTLGDPPEKLESIHDDDASSEFQPNRGAHLAAATTLADALARYWGAGAPPAAAGPGRGCSGSGDGEGCGPQGSAPPPLICPDLAQLAVVLSTAQAITLCFEEERAAGVRGAIGVISRPAALLRMAHMLSAELVARVPPVHFYEVSRDFARRKLYCPFLFTLEAALTEGSRASGPSLRPGVSSVASGGAAEGAAAASSSSDDAGAVEALLGRIRQLMGLFLANARQKDAAEVAKREAGAGLSAAGAAATVPTDSRGPAGGASSEQRQGQGRDRSAQSEEPGKLRTLTRAQQYRARLLGVSRDVLAAAAARLVAAMFDPLPALPGASPVAAAPAAAAAAGTSLQQEQAPAGPAPPAKVVCMVRRKDLEDLGPLAAAQMAPERVESAWQLAAAESANRAALARALVGAMTPCWTFSPPPPADSSPLPFSYSPHSSLVLQGAPAICYSLARTAAVNYVLDRVARGLAAAAAAAAKVAALATPVAMRHGSMAAGVFAVADSLSSVLAAGTEYVPPDVEPAHALAALAAVTTVADTLGSFHRACGWPLVMALSGGGEAQAQHARSVPEEVLGPSAAPDEELDQLRGFRLAATWATQRSAAAGAAASAAAGSTSSAGSRHGASLAEAVARRAQESQEIPIHGGSPGVIAQAVHRVEHAARSSPLRAARLAPSCAAQTAAAVTRLALLSEELRTDAAAPRELVVVPLLDAAALARCGEAQQRLRGVVRLVLRDLTEPVAAADVAAGAGAGAVEDEAKSGTAPFTAPRVLRPDWQVRLPLALDRAVCRVASVPLQSIGWQLSELGKEPWRAPHSQEESGAAGSASSNDGDVAERLLTATRSAALDGLVPDGGEWGSDIGVQRGLGPQPRQALQLLVVEATDLFAD